MNLEQSLHIIRLTDTGKLRNRNEDSIASDASIGLALLADGMGGYNAGDIASQMAALTITAELKARFTTAQQSSNKLDVHQAQNHLLEAINVANHAIFQVSNEQSHCAGMGTTLVAAVFIDNQVIIAHIGDSRAYVLRDEQLIQLTNDHSVLQEQLDAGLLSQEQARSVNYKNYVTRALGVDSIADTEDHVHPVKPNDIYLLCSDGLSDMVDDDEIRLTLSEHSDNLELAANTLIRKANMYGGKDNISLILIQVLQEFALKKPKWYTSLLKRYF